MAAMDVETIRAWIVRAEAELSQLSAEAERIQRSIAQVRTQLGLMYELLASATGEQISRHPDVEGAGKPIRERVIEDVVNILRDYHRPMRIRDIHAEFLRRELPLPGSGTPANIAAHLIDRDLFTRPRRGVFGLAEWGEDATSAMAEDSEASDESEEEDGIRR